MIFFAKINNKLTEKKNPKQLKTATSDYSDGLCVTDGVTFFIIK